MAGVHHRANRFSGLGFRREELYKMKNIMYNAAMNKETVMSKINEEARQAWDRQMEQDAPEIESMVAEALAEAAPLVANDADETW